MSTKVSRTNWRRMVPAGGQGTHPPARWRAQNYLPEAFHMKSRCLRGRLSSPMQHAIFCRLKMSSMTFLVEVGGARGVSTREPVARCLHISILEIHVFAHRRHARRLISTVCALSTPQALSYKMLQNDIPPVFLPATCSSTDSGTCVNRTIGRW